jgi:hypothetical protein
MPALLEFECRVPVGGYRILSLDERKLVDVAFANPDDPEDYSVLPPPNLTEDERYLLSKWGMNVVPHVPPGFIEPEVEQLFEPQSEEVRCFDLFEETPTVFLDFANTTPTLEGAKALADRFGPLEGPRHPEFVDNWYRAIREMRQGVRAWEKAKSTGNFSRIIELIAIQNRHFLRVDYRGGINACIQLRKDRGQTRLCICPGTLSAALWAQLALAIDGNQNVRTCAECSNWFPLEAGTGRSDKVYCSNACRMRAYRKRMGKAAPKLRRAR